MAQPKATIEELPAWQQAAIEVFCRPRRCGLHEAIARGRGSDADGICALIRSTVGCPLFRCLADEPDGRD